MFVYIYGSGMISFPPGPGIFLQLYPYSKITSLTQTLSLMITLSPSCHIPLNSMNALYSLVCSIFLSPTLS
ncbi:hypothetical protein FKM82_017496 [Ascaphus truei]